MSREADELVELLKGGRPISEVLKSRESGQQHHEEEVEEEQQHEQQLHVSEQAEVGETTPLTGAGSRSPSAPSSPAKAGDATDAARTNNGSLGETDKQAEASSAAVASSSGVVEVQRAVAAAPAESQAEHVVIKKKSKCNCCVLQ